MKDNFINGKCSMCGACCTTLLPISKKEIRRLQKYINRHKLTNNYLEDIKRGDIAITCPLLNKETNKCDAYKKRPIICKVFFCARSIDPLFDNEKALKDAYKEEGISYKDCKVKDLHKELFDGKQMSVKELSLLQDLATAGKL